MASNKPFIPKIIDEFIDRINSRRSSSQEIALRKATAEMPGTINAIIRNQRVGVMGVSATEAAFLSEQTWLVGQHGKPMKICDIGTFTGGTALTFAQAMPNGGKVVSCDIDPQRMALAQQNLEKAGVMDRVQLKLGPAQETLQKLLDNGEQGTFDLVFIDAEKLGYDGYYEKALELLRPGGLIILDNMLWSGLVADPGGKMLEDLVQSGKAADPSAIKRDTEALRALDRKIATDPRVKSALYPIGDGVMVARKLEGPQSYVNLTKRGAYDHSAQR